MTSFTPKGLPQLRAETLEMICAEFEQAQDRYILDKIEEISHEDKKMAAFLAQTYVIDPYAGSMVTLMYLCLRKEMEAAWEKPE